MNPEQFEQYIQGLVSNKKEQTSPIEEVKVESMEGNRDRSPPLTPRIAVSRPIAVVCPQSEVNRPTTPLFSSVTRTDLFDSVLCGDSDSENEFELLEEDSESEEDSGSEEEDLEVIQVDSDSENEENEGTVRNENID